MTERRAQARERLGSSYPDRKPGFDTLARHHPTPAQGDRNGKKQTQEKGAAGAGNNAAHGREV